MIVYIIGGFLSLTSYFVLFHVVGGGIHKNIKLMISSLPLVFISGFRYHVGTDYLTYERIFEYVKDGNWPVEPLFCFLAQLVQEFGGDFRVFLIVVSLLFVYLIFKRIGEDSPYPCFSIYLFITTNLYFASMNIMRQTLAMAVVYYAFKYIYDKRIFAFLFFVIIASFIHKTAVVMLVLYPLYYIRINWKLVASSFFVFLSAYPLIYFFIRKVISSSLYSGYINSQYDTGETAGVGFLICLLLIGLSYLFGDKDEKFEFYVKLQIVAAFIFICSSAFTLLGRFNLYLYSSSFILVPMIVDKSKDKTYRFLIGYCSIVLYFLYSYLHIGINGSQGVIPYQVSGFL